MKAAAIALAGAVIMLSGCSGETIHTAVAPSAGFPAKTGNARVAIHIAPRKTSAAKRPSYVSPATMGAAVSVYVDGATPPPQPSTVADLSSGSSNCTTNPDGSRTCTIPVAAPAGTDDIAVTLYDRAPSGGSAAGNPLATGTTIQTITANTTNNVTLTLNGIPAYVILSLNPAYITSGVAQSAQLGVQVQDADRDTITGPGNYAVPVTLTDSDTSGTYTLSSSSLTDPTVQFVTVNYSGAPGPASASFGAAAKGVATSAVTGATLALVAPSKVVLNPTNVAFAGVGGTNVQTVSVSEANYNGTFTATSSNCSNIVTLASSASSNTQFTFQSTGAGTCSYAISDGVNTQTLPFSVQIQPFSITPAQLTFLGTGMQPVTLNEPNYSGTFTADYTYSTCLNAAAGTGKASVSSSDGVHFSVQAVTAGACTVIFHDSNAGAAPQSATLNVSITTTTIGGH